MMGNREANLVVSRRITDRLRAHAEREGYDFADLRRAVWGKLFGVTRVWADRLAPDGALVTSRARRRTTDRRSMGPAGAAPPTVAAAVAEAKGRAEHTLADLIACAALKDAAFEGDREAIHVLEGGAESLAERLWDGTVSVQDEKATFESYPVPLRDVVGIPANDLASKRRNRLRSRLFRQSPTRSACRSRLGLIAGAVLEVLAPFYPSPGRRTFRERQLGRRKLAVYPTALMQDIAGLLIAQRPGEFDRLTANGVRMALRRQRRVDGRFYEPHGPYG